MLEYFILIFFVLLFYFIFFRTPFWISNLTFEFGKNRIIHIKYIIKKDKNYYVTPYYRFKHSEYDGKLVSNILRSKNFKLHKITKINKIQDFTLYKHHNIVNNLLNLNEKLYDPKYTKFANVCANIIKLSLTNGSSYINVAVVVNKRKDNNFDRGNYIVFAFFKVYKYMDNKIIMEKYYNSVNKAKNRKMTHFSLYDLYCLLNCDLILNSWRDLSIIHNKHNLLLQRYNKYILEKDDIFNFLKSKNKRKLVYFDYFEDKYVINKLEYLNVK